MINTASEATVTESRRPGGPAVPNLRSESLLHDQLEVELGSIVTVVSDPCHVLAKLPARKPGFTVKSRGP